MHIFPFVLFASLTIFCKFLTPWAPVSIVLAMTYWVGTKRHHTPKANTALMLLAWGLLYLGADLMFQWMYWHQLAYGGMVFNYIGILAVGLLAWHVPSYKKKWYWGVLGLSMGTFIFYTLSNFGVFLTPESYYPKTLSGLISCYIAGIPFVERQWMSNLVGGALIVALEYTVAHSTVLKAKFQTEA